MCAHDHNSSTLGAEPGGSWVKGWPDIHGENLFQNKRPGAKDIAAQR